jgi:hypothetical protein
MHLIIVDSVRSRFPQIDDALLPMTFKVYIAQDMKNHRTTLIQPRRARRQREY